MDVRATTRRAVALAALALSLWPGRAGAEPCAGTPGAVLETFPASGSRSAPRNGLALVVYCPPEDPFVDRAASRLLVDFGEAGPGCLCAAGGECLPLGPSHRCLGEVPTRASVEGDLVRLEALGGDLAPRTTHVIEAEEPSAVMRVSFVTGTATDQSAPLFQGPSRVGLIGCGVDFPASAACPADEEGLVVVLTAPAADDEAGRVNLEYLAYQVQQGGLVERGRARGDGAADVTMSFFVPLGGLQADEARICFRMGARDPYGHETVAEESVCDFAPDYSPFGSLCAVAPAGPARPDGSAVALVLAALLLSATRRRRG